MGPFFGRFGLSRKTRFILQILSSPFALLLFPCCTSFKRKEELTGTQKWNTVGISISGKLPTQNYIHISFSETAEELIGSMW